VSGPAAPGVRSPHRTAFVGRRVELRQLAHMREEARAGRPQLAVIEGPPGIGKTRLAEEVGARAERDGGRFALGACWQDGEAPAFWPWRTILAELDAPPSLLDEGLHSPRDRFARFQSVLDFLHGAVSRAPLVLVLDDAHLAEPASLLLARFLARARSLRLLLLLTRRREAVDAAATRLLDELCHDAVTLTLEGLSSEAVGDYLDLAGTPRPDPQLLQAVAAVTAGNPLHLRSIAIQSQLRAGVRGGLERTISDLLARLPADDRRLIALCGLLGADVAVLEVARVADVPPPRAAEALAHAAEAGLGMESAGGRFTFVHDLVRQTAMNALAPAERLEAHARAARLLAGSEPAQLARRAHHALCAAGRSREEAALAVETAVAAAGALRAEDGFESAAGLLARAAEIHAGAALDTPLAPLAVQRAESVLACGRLAQARPLFHQAARIAEREGDAVVLARSALGLGGVWVSEHRLADDAERMLALQRRALEALPAGEHVLRTRLRVRLAAEEAYRGGSIDGVLEGVEDARRGGDPHALAEALSLAHHALLAPAHTWRRRPLATEMRAAAAAAGDGLLSLLGLCWHAVDLALLGDPGAAAALEELRLRADALNCSSILFIVRCMEVMRLIRAGRFDEAEQAAAAACALGTEAGDADALTYQGAHLSAIRYFQGREAELADFAAGIAASPLLIDTRERSFAAAAVLFSLRAGRPEPAQALLQRLAREGIDSPADSSSWLTTMLAVVELAADRGDAALSRTAYDALLPYAELPAMASLAVVCFGSVHRMLGVAARTGGRLDLAIEHLGAALAANQQLGHRPAAIQAQAELGLARLRRTRWGVQDARGRALVQDAIEEAEATGMDGLAARWREEAQGAGAAAHASEAALMSLVARGKWRVVLGHQVATVPDLVGMRHLARLLATPDRGIPALTLVLDGAAEPAEGRPHEVMDRSALKALRERIAELRRCAPLSPGEREELETLTDELARSSGLGGRVRAFAHAPERARTSVQKAVKRAIDEIAAANPVIGQHLARRVETGSVCCYRSEPAGPSS
jgi:tetratricopeptide (TPR) repeat protein